MPLGGPSGALLASNDPSQPDELGVYVFGQHGGANQGCMPSLLRVAKGCAVTNFSDARQGACQATVGGDCLAKSFSPVHGR